MDALRVVGLIALCALAAFAGGCAFGKRASSVEVTRLASAVEQANGHTEACATALAGLQQAGRDELARAEREAEQAAAAVEDLVRENLALADQLGDVEARMARARQEPTCRQQLEVELCETVPLL